MRPEDCRNIEEVRDQIDLLDTEILELLGKRYGFVKEVVKYKKPVKASIIAQERFDAVIQNRRILAEKNGLNPDVIEDMYKLLINHFIEEEMNLIEKKK